MNTKKRLKKIQNKVYMQIREYSIYFINLYKRFIKFDWISQSYFYGSRPDMVPDPIAH